MHGLNFCTGDFVIIMDADFSHHVRLSAAIFEHRPHSNLSHSLQPKFIPQFIKFAFRPPSPFLID
jgi:hypothetical protein